MSPQERTFVTKPSFNWYNILDTGLIDKILLVTREEDEQLHGKVLAGIRTSIPEDTFFSIITMIQEIPLYKGNHM